MLKKSQKIPKNANAWSFGALPATYNLKKTRQIKFIYSEKATRIYEHTLTAKYYEFEPLLWIKWNEVAEVFIKNMW